MKIGLNIYDLTEEVRQVILDTAGMTIDGHLECALPLEICRDPDDRLLPKDIEDGTRVAIHQAHNDAVMFLSYEEDADLRGDEDPSWQLFWGESGSALPFRLTMEDEASFDGLSSEVEELGERLRAAEERLDQIDQLFSRDKVMSVLADLLAKANAIETDNYPPPGF